MKKHTTPYLSRLLSLLLVCLLPAALAAQSQFMSKLTPNLRKDMAKLQLDMKTHASQSVLLKDLERLDYHMDPQNNMSMEEMLQLKVLGLYQEYYDLRLACHYAIAGIYHLKGDSLKKDDALGDAISRSRWDGRSRSPLHRLVQATIEYIDLFPYEADQVVFSSRGIKARVSTMKDVLNMRHTLRELLEDDIAISQCPLANDLLAWGTVQMLPPWLMDAITPNARSLQLTPQFNQMLGAALAAMANTHIDTWVELKFPAQFLVNNIQNTVYSILNIKERDLNSLTELAFHGFGPASLLLGVRAELGTDRKENAQLAFTCYELAHDQGCPAGTIRLAHCYAIGYGCKADAQKALEMLTPLRNDTDFPRYGSYAYALLKDKGLNGKSDVTDLMACYAMAAASALKKTESQQAQDRIAQLYEAYYQ